MPLKLVHRSLLSWWVIFDVFWQVLPTVSESQQTKTNILFRWTPCQFWFQSRDVFIFKKPHTQRATHNGPDGCPSGPQGLLFDTTHDVDLCLVSPCEFKHFKPVGDFKDPLSPGFSNTSPLNLFDDSDHSQEAAKPLPPSCSGNTAIHPAQETPLTSSSDYFPMATDSDVHPGVEDCPSISADGLLDSDEEVGVQLQTQKPKWWFEFLQRKSPFAKGSPTRTCERLTSSSPSAWCLYAWSC